MHNLPLITLCVASSLFVFAGSVGASLCTDKCDAATTVVQLPFSVFCGIDNKNYNTTSALFTEGDCYSYCGVAFQYVGRCGCPNDCGSALGHGTCIGNGTTQSPLECQCSPGFSGKDCMTVDCSNPTPHNCSGHGTCATDVTSLDAFCSCEAGWTGAYCGQAEFTFPDWQPSIPNISSLLQPNQSFTTAVFNMSVIAELRIEMSDADFRYLIDPNTVYNPLREKKPAVLFFNNGNHRVSNLPTQLQVKGATSRLDIKKGWRLHFDDDNKLLGLTDLALKAGNAGGDSMLKPFLMNAVGRAVGVALPRPGMATLTINGVFMGLYFFDESVDDPSFLNAVFGTTAGSIVKLTYSAFLKFEGFDIVKYMTESIKIFGQAVLNFIETKDWTAYINCVYNLSLPNVNATDVFDVELLVRTVALEAFMLDDDHFVCGNNYWIFQNPTTNLWTVVDHDFDTELSPKHGGVVPTNVLDFPLDPTLNGGNPLVLKVFEDPVWMQRYAEIMKYLVSSSLFSAPQVPQVNGTLRDSMPEQSLPEVYQKLAGFVYDWVQADVFQQAAFGTTPQQFNQSAQGTSTLLSSRAAQVQQEVAPTDSGNKLSKAALAGIIAGSAVGAIAFIAVVRKAFTSARRRRLGSGYYQQVEDQLHY